MRNLKRVLSLALAVVMVVGLMVVGAGAASIEDFGDKAEITQTEAVALMADLEILVGDNAGNFNPKAYLDRQALAKITFLVATSQTNYSLYDTASCDLTDVDADGVWAKGAIKYCVNAGYISGNPDKTYSPNGLLTTVQIAKTLLCALGFNAEDRGYVGSGWDMHIVDDATELGLFEGLTDARPNSLITREDACRMAYNAMFAKVRTPNWAKMPTITGDMVEYITGYEVKNYTLGLKNHGLVKVSGTVDNTGALNLASATASPAVDATTLGNLKTAIGTNYDAALSADQTGSSVTVYLQGSSYAFNAAGEITSLGTIKPVSTAPAVGKGNVLATSTNGTTIAALTTKPTAQAPNPKFKAELGDSVTYILNGAVKDYTQDDADNKQAVDTAVAKKGVIVELIDVNSDGKAEVVKVTEKTVATLTADPVISKDGKQVTIAGVVGTATDLKNVIGYEGLKKDDVVLFVKIGNVTTIEKAEKITGTITAASSDKTEYTIGGTKYAFSGLTGKQSADAKTNFKDEQWFALDNGGNIVAFAKTGEAAPAPEVKHAVALAFGKKSEGSPDDLTAASKTVYQVKLLFTDGTSDVVTLNALMVPKANPDEGFDKFDLANNYSDLANDHVNKLVSYTVKDGKYTITEVGTAVETLTTVEGGKPVFTTDGATQLIGTKETTFVLMVGTGDKAKPQVVTGVANLNKASGDNEPTVIQYITDDDGFVTLAYMVIKGFDAKTTTDWVWFLKNTGATETATGYTVKAIKGDEIVDVVIAADKYAAISGAITSGLAEVTYDKDGKITAATAIGDGDITTKTGMVKKTGITMQGSYVKSGTDVYEVADDAVIVKIAGNKAEEVAVSSLKDALAESEAVDSYDALVVVPQGTVTIEVMYILVNAAAG